MKKNIIILGNDSEIETIDFKLLANKNCIIGGVNRIFYHTNVDYLLFLDNTLISELKHFNFSKTKLITNLYNFRDNNINYFEKKTIKNLFQENIFINDDIPSKYQIFGSVCTMILAFKKYIFKNLDLTFYLLRSLLKYDSFNRSHFWKSPKYNNYINNITNNHEENWYTDRFKLIRNSLIELKRKYKCNIIGCHESNKRIRFLDNISFDQLIKNIS